MPAKSRRNRRISSQNRKTTSAANVVSENIGATAELPIKTKSNAAYSLKPATALEPASKYVLGEIRWIGVVTLIVIVILVVLYIFLR